jgi:hypothetical protein
MYSFLWSRLVVKGRVCVFAVFMMVFVWSFLCCVGCVKLFDVYCCGV